MSQITNIASLYKKVLPVPYLSAISHFTIEFSLNSLPIFYPVLIATMGLSYQQIGSIALVVSIASTLSQPIFGLLSDRIDRKLFMVFSVTWVGVLVGLMGLFESYWMVVVILGLGSLGSAAFHPSGAALAVESDPNHRGAAAAIFTVSGGLGTALGPLVVGIGLARIGMKTSLIFIPLALGVTYFLLAQYRSIAVLESKSNAATKKPQTSNQVNSMALLALAILIVGARSWFHGGVLTYLPEMLHQDGLSTEKIGLYMAVFMVLSSLGGLFGGILSDKIGRVIIVAISCLLLGPVFWGFLNLTAIPKLLIIAMMGLALGLSFPVTTVMAQEAWPKGIGLASSLVMGLGWLPFGVGSWAIGSMADKGSLFSALSSLVYIPLISFAAVILYGIISKKVWK
ncbi:MAG: MFS transporter [Anaerolineaceae bacterium]|nr:MFS transporter [Anaerolineaceae bacterium]